MTRICVSFAFQLCHIIVLIMLISGHFRTGAPAKVKGQAATQSRAGFGAFLLKVFLFFIFAPGVAPARKVECVQQNALTQLKLSEHILPSHRSFCPARCFVRSGPGYVLTVCSLSKPPACPSPVVLCPVVLFVASVGAFLLQIHLRVTASANRICISICACICNSICICRCWHCPGQPKILFNSLPRLAKHFTFDDVFIARCNVNNTQEKTPGIRSRFSRVSALGQAKIKFGSNTQQQQQ